MSTQTEKRPARGAPQRFCADCDHQQSQSMWFFLTEHRCGAPAVADPVTRQAVYRCDVMRGPHAPCGPRARLFRAAVVEQPVRILPAGVVPPSPWPRAPARLMDAADLREQFGREIEAARA